MVIVDTNIIIDHLRRSNGAETLLSKLSRKVPQEELAISMISIQELFAGQSTRNDTANAHLLATVGPLKTLPYSFDIARTAGSLMRDYTCGLTFSDSAIAATCLSYSAELFTLNTKDFKPIKNLRLFKLK